MWPELEKQLRLEEAQLDLLLEQYRPLLEHCRHNTPSDYNMAALAAMLQSFYNGAENLFRRILRELKEPMPRGESWHQDLLEAMRRPAEHRPEVLSEELHDRLLEFLQFRHVFRSTYLFQLRWEKMAPLVLEIEALHGALTHELNVFIRRMASEG